MTSEVVAPVKAVIHIGDQKTGSKSIQHMLAENGERWRDYGTICPSSTKGGVYDIGLAAITRDSSSPSFRTYMNFQGIAQPGLVEKFLWAGLERELRQQNTAVFSYEGFLWMTSDEIAYLRERLVGFFDSFEIVVFLRRQDRKAVSLHSTNLLLGRGGLALLPETGSFDYFAALMRWNEHFEADAFTIYVYEEYLDTARTFAGHLDKRLIIEYPERQNEALSGKAQDVLRVLRTRYHDRLPAHREAMNLRYFLAEVIQGGYKALPSEAEARSFMQRFEAGNAMICAHFGLNRIQMFDDDYSEYKQQRAPNTFTADDMANLALSLWTRAQPT